MLQHSRVLILLTRLRVYLKILLVVKVMHEEKEFFA